MVVKTTITSRIYTLATTVGEARNLGMAYERTTRRTLVKVVLLLTADTTLAVSLPERKLLAQFVRGVITLEQLLSLVEERLETAKAIERVRQLAKGNHLLEARGR